MSSSQITVEDLNRLKTGYKTLDQIRANMLGLDPAGGAYILGCYNDLQKVLAEVPMTVNQREEVETCIRGIGYLIK